MKRADIARAADVNRSDVSNYFHSKERREKYVSEEKQRRIEAAAESLKFSKAEMALHWLQRGNTLTPIQSLSWFGLHSLSQQVTKWQRRGIDVRNIVPEAEKFHTHAIYALFINGEQVTGERR